MPKKPLPLAKSEATPPSSQPPDRWVALDNALNRAAQGLTLPEKRLVMIAVAQLNSKKLIRSTLDAPFVTRVRASEYAENAKVHPSVGYRGLKVASQKLEERKITFFDDGATGKRRGPLRVSMRWVGRTTYHDGEGWVELAWWPEVMPYLTGLESEFTEYQLRQAIAFRSLYSWRLLELLMQYKDTGWMQITIEEFGHAMDATELQRADFAAIRRKMIEPAVKELNEKDAWLVTWEPIKAGRKVIALRFTFARDDQLRLDLNSPAKPRRAKPPRALLDAPVATPPKSTRTRTRRPTEAELSAFARPGESTQDALTRWQQK